MVDLHTHSNVSDGNLSPALLIGEAVKQGVRAIALTDHDTTNGLEIARKEAEKAKIRFIPGIEINIQTAGLGPGGEFHLLGLGIHRPSPAFVSAIEKLSRLRENRNQEILDNMRGMGIEATLEDIQAFSGGHSLGRPHFASFLISRKLAKDQKQAFARYLGAGKCLYVPKEGLNFEEAAALIRESGGIPVLAHPMSLYIAWGRLPDVLKELKNKGLAGIEAWHPTAKARSCRRLEELGKALGFYITEGSDFHGSIRPERKLGFSNKGREIADTVLEAIPELAAPAG
ncbi:MAG TPA: PHP domain-containing protein [Treponema sp.]|nr:PHP domain-containing protein [Treponema sp.]